MGPLKDIERIVKKTRLKATEKLHNRTINDALQAQSESQKTQAASKQPNIWRFIMKAKITKLTAVAAIIIVVILAFNFMDAPIDGTSKVFAAAMDSIKQARTFSCMIIFEVAYEDEETEGKYLLKQQCMFKEPDLERHVTLTSPWPRFIGEVRIRDYSLRQELNLRPAEMKAILDDYSSEYVVDDKTGKLRLTELDTSLRDRLLELSLGTFDDLGYVELDGKSVLKLESEKNGRVDTVWIDPKTSYPVQIEKRWPGQERSPALYTSIQIDVELDDELFSLEPPGDYDLTIRGAGGWTDYQRRLGAKMGYLFLRCIMFSQNNNEYPEQLTDLEQMGVKEDILRTVLSATDQPDEPAVIQYRIPNPDAEQSQEVILYQKYDQWQEEGIVVCFMDGGRGIIKDQNRFEQLIK